MATTWSQPLAPDVHALGDRDGLAQSVGKWPGGDRLLPGRPGVAVLAVTALADGSTPRTAAADRRRGRAPPSCRSSRGAARRTRSCCSGCCRRCSTRPRIQTSLVDFNANRRAILLLSVGLVVFTTAGVGVLVHALLPGSPGRVAFAIGAVVAPPDAVAATAIGRRIGLPRRIVTILEGESLLNDATALVALRTAIAAGAPASARRVLERRRSTSWSPPAAACSSAFADVPRRRRGCASRITDPVLDTAISLVMPFAAYIAAEEIHASGVLAVVIAGLLLGHKAPILQTAQSRIAERMNWRTIAFLLENTVFLLIGLQARWILEDVRDSDLAVGRIVARLRGRPWSRWSCCGWCGCSPPATCWSGRPRPGTGAGRRGATPFLLGWAGMRGVVTLAAAFVIPEDTEYREVLLLIAFTVVAGTLFLQGLTLPWLARRSKVPAPDPAEDALARATLLQQASKAGLEVLEREECDDPHGVRDLIRAAARAAQLRRLGAARHGQRAARRRASSTPGSGWR